MINKTKNIIEIAFSCLVGFVAGVTIYYSIIKPVILWVARGYYGQE